MRAWLSAAVAALAVQACTVDADYAGVGFDCSAQEPCQSGLSCVMGTCRIDSEVIDASTDAPGDSADAMIIECLPPIALSDEFPGDTIDAQWTTTIDVGTTLAVAGGIATLTPTTANPPRFARLRSAAFAMDGKRVFVEVPTMVNTATMAIGEFLLGASVTDFYFMRQSQGVLQFGTTIGGTELILTATSYESANQRWWQMRMIGGRVFADVSADGAEWTNLASTAADGITGDLFVDIGAGTRSSVVDPGQMQVDNVNAGSGLCP